MGDGSIHVLVKLTGPHGDPSLNIGICPLATQISGDSDDEIPEYRFLCAGWSHGEIEGAGTC